MSTKVSPRDSDFDKHLHYLRLALAQAQQSPPKPTNFCVGAVLLDPATDSILSTGYTLELPGNTHAEQVCLLKLCNAHNVPEEDVSNVLPETGAVLYTTIEPCVKRLSGNESCVERILRAKRIQKVIVGVMEPDTFVKKNEGFSKLKDAKIEVVKIDGLEEEILKTATAGHRDEKNEAFGMEGS
jgi:pyrimidine deaminase RibD-like protein